MSETTANARCEDCGGLITGARCIAVGCPSIGRRANAAMARMAAHPHPLSAFSGRYDPPAAPSPPGEPAGEPTPCEHATTRQFGDVVRCDECGDVVRVLASTPANGWNGLASPAPVAGGEPTRCRCGDPTCTLVSANVECVVCGMAHTPAPPRHDPPERHPTHSNEAEWDCLSCGAHVGDAHWESPCPNGRCPRCGELNGLASPGCVSHPAPAVAPVAGVGGEEPAQGEPRVCMVEEHNRTRTLCGRAWVRPPEAHGTRVYQCQACLRIATLTEAKRAAESRVTRAPVAGGTPTPCPRCAQFRELLAVCPGCSQPLAPAVAPVAGAEGEDFAAVPESARAHVANALQIIVAAHWNRLSANDVNAIEDRLNAALAVADAPDLDATDGAHPAWWRGCDHGVEQTCRIIGAIIDGDPGPHNFGSARLTDLSRRIATLTASLASMQRKLDALRLRGDHWEQTAKSYYTDLADAESRVATLEQERDDLLDALTKEQAAFNEEVANCTKAMLERDDFESRLATLHRGREAMREALDAMATAGRALYEEGAGEGDPRAQEALWTVGKRLYETACDMAATLSESQPEALSQPTRKPSND